MRTVLSRVPLTPQMADISVCFVPLQISVPSACTAGTMSSSLDYSCAVACSTSGEASIHSTCRVHTVQTRETAVTEFACGYNASPSKQRMHTPYAKYAMHHVWHLLRVRQQLECLNAFFDSDLKEVGGGTGGGTGFTCTTPQPGVRTWSSSVWTPDFVPASGHDSLQHYHSTSALNIDAVHGA